MSRPGRSLHKPRVLDNFHLQGVDVRTLWFTHRKRTDDFARKHLECTPWRRKQELLFCKLWMSAHTLAASSLHNLLNMPWNCYEAFATLNGLLGGRYKYGLQQHAVRRFTHTRWTIQTFQCHDQECTVQRIVTQCAIDLGACRSVSVSFRYPLQMQRVTQLKRLQKIFVVTKLLRGIFFFGIFVWKKELQLQPWLLAPLGWKCRD